LGCGLYWPLSMSSSLAILEPLRTVVRRLEVRTEAPRRIPGLDGLRGISILLVLFGHLVGTSNFPLHDVTRQVADTAHFGVTAFFVLSGFLITSLLQAELAKTGTIALRRFYLRRALRLLPAFLTYLAVIAVAHGTQLASFAWRDFWSAATYTINFTRPPSWVVGHFWSLSVEEQFYVLWPAVLLLVGIGRAAKGAAALVLVAPVLYGATWLWYGSAPWWAPADSASIAFGCLLAVMRPRLHALSVYRSFLRSRWCFLTLVIPVVGIALAGRLLLSHAIARLWPIVAALMIDRAATYPVSGLTRFLETPALTHLGVLSYSLYVWQQLFLNRTSSLAISAFPLNIAAAYAVACCSYYLVEKPIRDLGRFVR
jgi:peptidoglycan/LPS O-acetylase OafA/YrhL